ncbi:hypothetical protein GOODEAATRI_009035 [Goodea atripinnis]|uniref:SH3 domain-containing protein n=1 Tax=Goodea atripinnis TaxID=208336 RepID=A0ABV0NAJ7_9TELE
MMRHLVNARLSFLAENKKLWSQKMFLDIGSNSISLRDVQSQDELEQYSFKDIYRCDAIDTEKHFPSLLLLVCQRPNQKKPDIQFFNCEPEQAQLICEEIRDAVSDTSSSSKKVPDAHRVPKSKEMMYDPYDIPSPPLAFAPNPPPVNPPPYPGLKAVSLLQGTLNEEEKGLWTSLGANWTLHRSQLRGPVASYTPVFLDGWKPEAMRADGQVWEDPVESQHKHEAHRVKQEQQPPQQPGPPVISNKEVGPSAEAERLYMCSYDFIARNNSELSVQQGETLEVIESSRRWWKCRNRFNQVGFVPSNILEPVDHIDSPVSKPPSAPAQPPVTKSVTPVPPSPPALHLTPSHSPQRPRSSPTYSQHIPVAEETDKGGKLIVSLQVSYFRGFGPEMIML